MDCMLALSEGDRRATEVRRLPLGETGGRNEAWLRDTLLTHPEILPVGEIDPGYGPMVPLCRELRTEAGPLDLAFISPNGRLTLVECKLWKNPEARRKVVAQTLDYASAISRWSYSDLQRQVSQATGRHGNVPFELVVQRHPGVDEARFVDATARSLRAGRFLLLIVGDGIREDVQALTEYINRTTAADFTLGLVEVALYDFAGLTLLVQPRVIAKTVTLERFVLAERTYTELPERAEPVEASRGPSESPGDAESPRQAEYRAWWAPVIEAGFDDPDQEPAKLYWPNHVRAPLPWPQAWVTAYRYGGAGGVIGVGTGGRNGAAELMLDHLRPRMESILAALPEGFEFRQSSINSGMTLEWIRPCAEFTSEHAMQQWAAEMLNRLANAIRVALKP